MVWEKTTAIRDECWDLVWLILEDLRYWLSYKNRSASQMNDSELRNDLRWFSQRWFDIGSGDSLLPPDKASPDTMLMGIYDIQHHEAILNQFYPSRMAYILRTGGCHIRPYDNQDELKAQHHQSLKFGNLFVFVLKFYLIIFGLQSYVLILFLWNTSEIFIWNACMIIKYFL